MSAFISKARTIRELLEEIRAGYQISLPVLISQPAPDLQEWGDDATVAAPPRATTPLAYSRDYASETFTILQVGRERNGSPLPVFIGRSRRRDVVVDHASVSKKHASIVLEQPGDKFYLTDEESKNGTCINGQPIKPSVKTPLRSGAYITFGHVVLVFLDPATLHRMA